MSDDIDEEEIAWRDKEEQISQEEEMYMWYFYRRTDCKTVEGG